MSNDMSAESPNLPDTFADQLKNVDESLRASANDVDMLTDIRDGISKLLASSPSSEAQIRRTLQESYEAGVLRKETFQLVKSLLDRFVTEKIPTAPTEQATAIPESRAADTLPGDDSFGSTTIIPVGLVAANSPESRVQVGSMLRDRFMLQEKVSGGSMGVVYKAMDRRLAESGSNDHWVAVKVLSPQLAQNGQALRALQQEAAKGRCLVHPNIVRFIDLDRDDDLYFLVMEWLEGRTLADILDSKDADAIDRDAAFRIVRQVGDALDYAHRCGIVHADVKPGNIMITPNGDAKLFDFGVARVRQQHADSDFDPGVLGAITPAYSSMQVLTGEEPVPADDVFSLSCLFYRLLAGYRVYGPRNAAEASEEGMKPQRLKELNDSQWKALKKGLANARVMRFETIHEFIEAVNENTAEPFVVEAPNRFSEDDGSSGSSKSLVALLAIVGLGLAAGYQYGYLDRIIERLDGPEQVAIPEVLVEDSPLLPEPDPIVSEPVAKQVPDATELPELGLPVFEAIEPVQVGPDPMLVDFSRLPEPTETITFTPGRPAASSFNVAIREDNAAVIIDFVRDRDLATPLSLRLEEVGFSGNRSPWAAGQYALSNSGLILFPAGQERGRITLTMASDTIRESDQQSTLRLRESEFADSELAVIRVTLEDDDRRVFEAGLPVNTVAFASREVIVRETDPAVQIDLVRLNPDSTPLNVNFSVTNVTAENGQDFFSPGGHAVFFGPNQRTARLLVPLVQDSDIEGDESFVVELGEENNVAIAGIERRLVVVIRDDESQTR